MQMEVFEGGAPPGQGMSWGMAEEVEVVESESRACWPVPSPLMPSGVEHVRACPPVDGGLMEEGIDVGRGLADDIHKRRQSKTPTSLLVFSNRSRALPKLDTLPTRFLMPDDDLAVQMELLKLRPLQPG